MKTIFKLTLVAALMMAASSSYAQKFGYINVVDLVTLMPENDSAALKLQTVQKELSEQLDAVQVEYNNMYQDMQKNFATYSDAIKEMKSKQLNDLQTRFTELQQVAQQQFQKSQADLLNPVYEKAQQAIDKVSKDNGFTLVFNTDVLAYYNTATVIDVLPLVKKELNLKDKPEASAAGAAAPAAAQPAPAAK